MRLTIPLACSLLLTTGTLSAQVGHDPARSPYRTLRYGQFVSFNAAYLNGDGGQIGVAPHKGATFGLRYDFLGANTLTLGLAASYGSLDRLIVDKYKPAATTGTTGPVKQSVTLVEGIFQFNVTGGKSWHGIAPFVGAGLGLVFGGSTPIDTSGFKFRTKFAFTPGIGARLFLSDRLFLRLEARNIFWQLSYPQEYRRPPSADPLKPPAITGSGKEWTATGWYTVGLSYAFHRPF